MNYNQYIITTRYVAHENSPIVKVIHDEDGDWQFLGNEEDLIESDAVVLSLEEIIGIDNSLRQIIDLPTGKKACRNDEQDAWIISNFDYDNTESE